MLVMTRKTESILNQLNRIAYGNGILVMDAFKRTSVNGISKLEDIVNYILKHRKVNHETHSYISGRKNI